MNITKEEKKTLETIGCVEEIKEFAQNKDFDKVEIQNLVWNKDTPTWEYVSYLNFKNEEKELKEFEIICTNIYNHEGDSPELEVEKLDDLVIKLKSILQKILDTKIIMN